MSIGAELVAQSWGLHCCPSLQVLFNLCRVFAVEALSLLVELGVPLVDVVDVGVVVVGPAAAVFGSLLDSRKKTGQCVKNVLRHTPTALKDCFNATSG